MSQKPLEEMANTGYENMSEEAGYILAELNNSLKHIYPELKSKLGLEEYNHLERMLSGKVSKAELSELQKFFTDVFATKESLSDVRDFISKGVVSSALADSLKKSVTELSREQDQHRIERSVLELTSSEVLNLKAAPKSILPAPGLGKAIEVNRIELFLDHEGSDYTIAADNELSFYYKNTGEALQIEGTGLLDQSTDQRRIYHQHSEVLAENEGLFLEMLGAAEVSAAVVQEITDVTFSQAGSFYDVDGEGKYIKFSVNGSTHIYWFNVTDGGNTQNAPLVEGKKFKIDVLAADTSANIATKFEAGLDFGLTAPAPAGSVVTATHSVARAEEDAESVDAAAISVTTQGVGSPKLKLRIDYRVLELLT
jgi:hypothetical protein